MAMNTAAFNALLQRVKANSKTQGDRENVSELIQKIAEEKPSTVDLTKLGINNDTPIDAVQDVIEDIITINPTHNETKKVLGVSKDVTLNSLQQEFLESVVFSGEDVVLIGAAGTGKTTSMRRTTRALIDDGKLPKIDTSTKYLHIGSPGAAILSYTRKAVNNIRHAVVDELKDNTLTIHKLLEFQPIFYEIEDSDKPGMFKKTMRFEPSRNDQNPLPSTLKLIVIEESSMVSVELYDQLIDALPHEHQEVFLGDIQQLPPVFGMAILGFKMNLLKVIELREVYRQARESPIIDLAWKLLEGNKELFHPRTESFKREMKGKSINLLKVPTLEALTKKTEVGEVKFQAWQKKLSSEHALLTSVKQFTAWADQGYYDPENDIILCPFNKALGTVEVNNFIANHLGKKREALVYEVISGYNTYYLAVGDRVLYDKEDAYITEIRQSVDYMGKRPQPASVNLDRWGHQQSKLTEEEKLLRDSAEFDDQSMEALEKFMEQAAGSDEERVQAASHTIVIKYAYDMSDDPTDSSREIVLKSAAEINALLGGYAITVHKAQGSEYDRVFLLLHQSHAVMVSRELLYTAVTRAKKFLHIICETDTFYKGVQSQRVKGDTIAEKAEFFKGKASEKQIKQEELKLQQEKEADKLAIKAVRYEIENDPLYDAKAKAQVKSNLEYQREQEAKVNAAINGTKVTWDQPPPKIEVIPQIQEKTKLQLLMEKWKAEAPKEEEKEEELEFEQLKKGPIEEMLDDAEACPRLNDFETKFIESIRDWFDRTGKLSEKQQQLLAKICNNKVYIT